VRCISELDEARARTNRWSGRLLCPPRNPAGAARPQI